MNLFHNCVRPITGGHCICFYKEAIFASFTQTVYEKQTKMFIAFLDDLCQGDSKSTKKKIEKSPSVPRFSTPSMRIQPFDDYLWFLQLDFKC